MIEENWWSKLHHVFRGASKEEVKTPLAFFFRSITLLPVVIGAVLLTNESPDFKFKALVLVVGVYFAMCLMIAVFAWHKPKNLVYGESGHRAELKMEYGTEKHVLTHREVSELRGQPNPEIIEDFKQLAEENR